MADPDDAHSDTVMAAPPSAPAAHLATLDVASAGGELTARARLPIVARELYEVLGEFARGGLGRIVRARDTRSGRLVALKEMLRGTPDAAARFEREAVVTANLQHPAIVPVYEVGRWPDGEPFFAMKLVQGRSLADAIASTTNREARLALLPHVIAVAEALSYAHAQGWIHRDLKPHNVLVGDHGETVVIDWGLARRASDQSVVQAAAAEPGDEATDATIAGSVLGTPAYMAPEQASGVTVDERADVYAIGAMLRHLLVGAPAFADSRNVQHLLERVRTSSPPPLSDVAGWLPADLIAIVERAMARDVDARYATAGLLAEDLRRFTTGQLVAAHRYTRMERLRRFVRRNRAALAVAAVALTISIAYGAWSLRRIVDERDAARAATVRAEAATADADRQRATATERLGTLFADRGRLELLEGHPQRALPYLAEAMRLGEQGPEARFVIARALEQVDRAVARWPVPELVYAAFAPDSRDLIVLDQRALWRRGLDGTERWRAPLDKAGEMTIAGPDAVVVAVPGGLRVLDAASGAIRHDLQVVGLSDVAAGVAATPDGKLVIAGYEDGKVRAWDLATGGPPTTFDTGAPADFPYVTPNGRVIVNGFSPQRDVPTTTWDARTGKRLSEPCPSTRRCTMISVAADGRAALGQVTGNLGGVDHVELYDPSLKRVGGFELRAVAVDLLLVPELVLTLGDRSLDAYALDGTFRWSAAIGNGGRSLAVSRDGARVVAATIGGDHAVIELSTGIVVDRQTAAARTDVVAFSADGTHVMGFGFDRVVTAWDASRSPVTPITTTAARTWRITFADATTIVAGTEDGEVSIRDATTGAERRRIHAHKGMVLTAQVWPGLGLITSSGDGTACRWDVGSGKQLACWTHGAKIRRAEPSPDRRVLATAGVDGAVKLWDVSTGALITSWTMRRPVMNVRWAPDGVVVAAIDEAGDVELREARTGAVVRDEPGLGGDLFAGVTLEFSPDGTFLATGRRSARDGLIHTSDAARDVVLEGDAHGLEFGLGFSPDGSRLASAGDDQHLRVWETATGRALQSLDTGTSMHALAWSPDGEMIVTGGSDRLVRVWDADGFELTRLDAGADIYTLQVSPDGSAVAIGTDAPTALIWRLTRFDGTPDELAAIVRCRGLHRLDGDQLLPQDAPVCP